MDLYILLYGSIYLLATILDSTVVGDNLELYTLTYLIGSIILLKLANIHLQRTKIVLGVGILITIAVLYAFIEEVNFGVFDSEKVFQSEYKFLDTNEYQKLHMFIPLLLQFTFLWTIYKVIRDIEWSSEIRVYLVYLFLFLIFEIQHFVNNSMEPLMYMDLNLYIKVSSIISPIVFTIVFFGLTLNLIWKR